MMHSTSLALPHQGTQEPWLVYDLFVQGISVSEIIMQGRSKGIDILAASINADIELMRRFERERNPNAALTDADCDELRNIHLLIRTCKLDISGGSMKAANELGIRRDLIIHHAQQRYEE